MSSHQHPYGKPENVLGFAEDSKVFVRDEPLKAMFLHPEVKHRKIVAFSIIGAYRKGKSFFLDYCLRYLYAHYPSINFPNNPVSNPNEWIGEEDEPLKGFAWRPGTIRITTGLEVWNDVFLYNDKNSGQDVAIFVMDTHGLFDSETSSIDNSRIFTLGTLISSIEILNLSGVIQDDQLQYLQFATECAKYASIDQQESSEKCFQNLLFLIRDWDNPDEFSYGIDGGNKYLKHFIDVTGKKKKELKYVCQSIYDSFENICCSLLTHPGKIVSRGKRGSQEYTGSWKGMDEDFRDQLFALIDHLLKPNQLAVKKVNGVAMDGENFLKYFLNQLELFQTDELLKAQTLRDSMTEKEMEGLVNLCIEHYKNEGNKNKGSIKSDEDIPKLHEFCKREALNKYDGIKKMGNADDCVKYRKILDEKVDQLFNELMVQLENDRKKLEEETEKIRLELEQQQKIKLEKIAEEKRIIDEQLQADRQKARLALEHENKLKELEIAEINKQAELDRIAMENQREKRKQETKEAIEVIQNTVEESRLQFEELKKKKQEKLDEEQRDMTRGAISKFQTQIPPIHPTSVQKVKETSLEDIQKWKNDLKSSLEIEVDNSLNNNNWKVDSTSLLLSSTLPISSNSNPTKNFFQSRNFNQYTLTGESKRADMLQEPYNSNDFAVQSSFSNPSNYSTKVQEMPSFESSVVFNPIEHTEPKGIETLQHPNTKKEIVYGEFIQVVSHSFNNLQLFDEDSLKNIFENSEVQNRKIVAFSIAGNASKEKFELFDQCLNYLYHNYTSLNKTKYQEQIKYYDQGINLSGIFIWNDVFFHNNPRNFDKIAIIVMNIQGLINDQSLDDAQIFALGTLFSSIEILDLSEIIHKTNLQSLCYASNVASRSLTMNLSLPNLVFLVRNWVDKKYSYGIEGGNKYLKKIFSSSFLENSEMKSIREVVRNSFKSIDCMLLPNSFSNASILDEEIKKLINFLLSPEKLMPKVINERFINGREFFFYIKSCLEHFESNFNVHQQNTSSSSMNDQLNGLVELCFDQYKKMIYKNIDVITSAENTVKLHKMSKESALKMLKDLLEDTGCIDTNLIYSNKLVEQIEDIYLKFQNPSAENIAEFEKEGNKIALELQDRQKLEEEFALKEKRLNEFSKIQIENANLINDKKILQLKLKHEQDLRRRLESQIALSHKNKSNPCKMM